MKGITFFLWFIFLILILFHLWTPVLADETSSAEIHFLPKYVGADGSPFLIYINFQGDANSFYKFSVVLREKSSYQLKSQLWDSAEQKWQGGYAYQNFQTDGEGRFEKWLALKTNEGIDTSLNFEFFYRVKNEAGEDIATVKRDSGFQIINSSNGGWLNGHVKDINDRYSNKLVVILDGDGNYITTYICENNNIDDYEYDIYGDGYFKVMLPALGNYKIRVYDLEQKFWLEETSPIWESSEEYEVKTGEITSIDPNQAPTAILQMPYSTNKGAITSFDASQTIDPEGNELTYSWDFGDGNFLDKKSASIAEHTYNDCGKFQVKLMVSDGELEEKAEREITVLDMVISEILPSPAGSDATEEWIEIYNRSNFNGDLEGWIVSDMVGSTKNYIFPSAIIGAKSFLLIRATESKISLNNDQDGINFLLPNGQKVDSIEYASPKENYSYGRFEDGWHWTAGITPGAPNCLYEPPPPEVEEIIEVDYYQPVGITEIYALQVGTKVRLEGFVTVAPRNFAKTYFYVQDENGSARIYQYRGYFPDLAIGQRIIVKGEINHYQGKIQIKIRGPEDIEIAPNGKELSAIYLTHDNQLPLLINRIITFRGEITDINKNSFHAKNKNIELVAHIKDGTGINLSEFNMIEGDWVEISGFLIPYKDSYQLWPRRSQDIKLFRLSYNDNGRDIDNGRELNYDAEAEIKLNANQAKEVLSQKNDKILNIIGDSLKIIASSIFSIDIARAADSEQGIIIGTHTDTDDILPKDYLPLQAVLANFIIISFVWQIFLRKPT